MKVGDKVMFYPGLNGKGNPLHEPVPAEILSFGQHGHVNIRYSQPGSFEGDDLVASNVPLLDAVAPGASFFALPPEPGESIEGTLESRDPPYPLGKDMHDGITMFSGAAVVMQIELDGSTLVGLQSPDLTSEGLPLPVQWFNLERLVEEE